MQKYYDVAGVSGLVKVRTTSVILQAWKGDQNHKKFTFSFRPPSPSPFELAFHLGIRCSGGAGVVSKNRCHSKITGGGERHYLVKRAKLSPWSCCLSSVPSNNTATPVLSSIWECCVVRSIQKRMPLVNKSRCQKKIMTESPACLLPVSAVVFGTQLDSSRQPLSRSQRRYCEGIEFSAPLRFWHQPLWIQSCRESIYLLLQILIGPNHDCRAPWHHHRWHQPQSPPSI